MNRDEIAKRIDVLGEPLRAFVWAYSRMDELLAAAEARGDDRLTADESDTYLAMVSTCRQSSRELAELGEPKVSDASDALDQLSQRLDDIDKTTETRAAASRSASKYGGTKVTNGNVNEPDLYRKGGEHSFFRDVINAGRNPQAQERLLRHERYAASQVEARDLTTGDFAGLIVPQYLVADYAPIAHAGRPFANQWFKPRFPAEGMTLNVPRGNTGTLVGSQTTQNTQVSEQDHTVVDIVVPVVTIAGMNDLSRQSVDRGSMSDEVVMMDLAAAYAAELDRQLTHGTGANNEHFGIMSTTNIGTITMTSTDAITQMRLVGRAVSDIATNRKLPPNLVVLHPRRWAYWSQSTDSDGRPLIGPSDIARNVLATTEDAPLEGIVGRMFGMPVLVDANFATTLSYDVTAGATTDPIIVTRREDLFLYESSPVPRRVVAEQVLINQLSVRIVAWDYSAVTAARYTTATMVLAGSGLTTPTWATQ